MNTHHEIMERNLYLEPLTNVKRDHSRNPLFKANVQYRVIDEMMNCWVVETEHINRNPFYNDEILVEKNSPNFRLIKRKEGNHRLDS